MAVVCAVVGFGMYRAVELVLSAEALTVTRITVRGNERLSRGEVLALLEGLSRREHGDRRSRAVAPEAAERRRGSPMRRFGASCPGTLAVLVSERQPMAIGRIRDVLYLIDHQGTIIDEFGPNYAEFDLPIVDGLASRRPGAHARRRCAGGARRAPASASCSGVPISRRGSRRSMSPTSTTPSSCSRTTRRSCTSATSASSNGCSRTSICVPALRERMPEIDYVDLRFDERVYVRPSRGRRQRGS